MNPLLNMLFSLMFPNIGGMNNQNSGMNGNPLLNMLMGGNPMMNMGNQMNNNNNNMNNQMMGNGSGNPLMDMLMGGMNPNMSNNNMNQNNNPNNNQSQGNPMNDLEPLLNMFMNQSNQGYINTNDGRRHKHSKSRKRR